MGHQRVVSLRSGEKSFGNSHILDIDFCCFQNFVIQSLEKKSFELI
jgi:hypothetical protein